MKIHTQAELSANIDSKEILEIVAAGVFAVTLTGTQAPSIFIGAGVTLDVECRGSSQPRVECRESSQPRVVCRESSQPRVECRGSSQPRVECRESSQPRVVCRGSSQPRVVCRESSQPRVECRGSSQPRVVCRESSQPRVECWGSSQPRVECWESSQPRVECWESSQPRVECRGSSQPRVECWESSQPRVECWESSQPRVECRGSSQPRVECWESSQPRVECWESSQPRVECRGSSQPRVECWESSQPRVECRGSSQPRVECWESSQPRVEAQGYSQCSFFGRISAKCGPNVSALIAGPATVEGGKQTVIDITTPRAWCDYYGVAVSGEIATLFKAVGADGKSPRGTDYSPGLIPTADDWDGGARECGGGLHYSPTPAMARSFFDNAKRYMACPVALSDIAVHPDGQYPEKCKARGCCAPTYEVDEDGVPLLPQTVSEVTP